jgi:hypothetical protein
MIRLLSSNYREVEYANASAVTCGQFIAKDTLGGALNAFAFQGYGAAAKGSYVTFAERAAATKVAGDDLAFAPGERVHYNVVGAKVSKTLSDPLIGYAKRAALAADTEVIVEFDGALSTGSGDLITLADISDLSDLDITMAQITDLGDLDITMAQITDLGDLALADLADVNAAGVTNNDTLKYDTATSKWIVVAVTD